MLNLATVALSAVALIAIWRMVREMDRESGDVAAFGSALIIYGGLGVALKRLITVFTTAPAWLPSNLFGFLVPGFICLAFATWMGQRAMADQPILRPVWLGPIALIGGLQLLQAYLVGLERGPSLLVLQLSLTTLASIAFTGLCMLQALRQRQHSVVWMLGLYWLSIVLLNVAQHASMAVLFVQALNIVSAALFALAANRLSLRTRERLVLRAGVASLP